MAAEYPEVSVAYQHVDAATIHLVTDPGRFDVIVTDNLFGDILTDLAAAVAGGIGLAASGNVNPAGPRRPCSSRCTAPRRTSPAGAMPTRPRRSCRWRCCWTTWATPSEAARVEAAVAADLAGRDPGRTGSHRRDRRPDRRPLAQFGARRVSGGAGQRLYRAVG